MQPANPGAAVEPTGGEAERERPMWFFPLVGRDAEVEYAAGVLEGGKPVVVAGPAGVGKSRLLEELATRFAAAGWSVERAIGTHAAQAVPLSALAHLVPAELLDAPREGVLGAIVGALRDSRPNEKLLICVDDAHLLDDASATLVQLLARPGGPAVVVVVRSDEPVSDAIVSLWKDGAAPRLELQALSEAEIDTLTTTLLGGRVDRATLRMLWDSTRGNVLFLRVLIQQGLAEGTLNDQGGLWRWHGPTAIGPSLRELIGTRLDRLSAEQRAALEVVAVAEPIAVSALAGMVDAGALDALERETLVEVRREGARRVVCVGHPLYGEVLRARTPTGRADAISVAIADAIEATGMRRVDDVLRVATFRVDGGAATRAELLVRAARQAWKMHDTRLVHRLVTAALASGPNAEASYLLGETFADRRRYNEAIAHWDALLDTDAPDCDDMLRARIAASAASVLATALGRPDDAEAFIARAENLVTSSKAKGRLAGTRTMLFAHHRPDEELRPVADALLAAADSGDEASAFAWIASARIRLAAGEFDSVLAESDAIDERAQRAREGWPMSTLFVSVCRFFALISVGRLDDADALSQAGMERSLDDPMPFGRVYWGEALGLTALARGNLDNAEAHLNEVVAIMRPADNGTLRIALCELGMVHALRGDTAAAEATLEEAANAIEGIIEPYVYPERVRAAALAAAGNVSGARELIRAHAEQTRALDRPFYEVPALHDLARYGGAAAAIDRMTELLPTFDGPVLGMYVDQARALIDSDGDALMAVAETFAAFGFELDAAESAAAAAAAYSAAGARTNATTATRFAGEHAARCRGARTYLLATREEIAVLSKREREVAELAAGGLTDAEIADQLFLSIRTINSHLRSVYMKLGVANRRELTRQLLGPEKPTPRAGK